MPRVYPPIEGRQTSSSLSHSVVESVGGFTAGIVSTLVAHPFDVVKTRLQSEFPQAWLCRKIRADMTQSNNAHDHNGEIPGELFKVSPEMRARTWHCTEA